MATTEELAQLEELMEMVGQAQRRETDLGTVQLSELSRRLREQVESAGDGTDLLWAAESLQQLTKLLELKMGRRLDDASDESLGATPALATGPDRAARLEEYRIFKAAAGVLLADSSAGPKAFLRVLGLPVQPQAALHLSPETLASAFGELLSRLPEVDELRFSLPRYSVEEKVAELRVLLKGGVRMLFDEVFGSARDRMEAVALFLALLELIWSGEASCTQDGLDGPILVERAVGG
jgi:chromatin segregation and condensation protein Rec8/ScpA/Scc1 (kleisin family)